MIRAKPSLSDQNLRECTDSVTGLPRQAFSSEKEAISQIATEWEHRLRPMLRFKCTRCRQYHLLNEDEAPPVLNEVSQRCEKCTSAAGVPKVVYARAASAQHAMNQLTANQGVGSRTYPCPAGNGWHVAKDRPPKPRRPRIL